MVPNVRIIRFDRGRFAELVARSYYSVLSSLLGEKHLTREEILISGVVQWRRTHEEVQRQLTIQGASVGVGLLPDSQTDTGFMVRDVYVRVMIALYAEGPRPVQTEQVVELAQRLLDSPSMLPKNMESIDLTTRIIYDTNCSNREKQLYIPAPDPKSDPERAARVNIEYLKKSKNGVVLWTRDVRFHGGRGSSRGVQKHQLYMNIFNKIK